MSAAPGIGCSGEHPYHSPRIICVILRGGLKLTTVIFGLQHPQRRFGVIKGVRHPQGVQPNAAAVFGGAGASWQFMPNEGDGTHRCKGRLVQGAVVAV